MMDNNECNENSDAKCIARDHFKSLVTDGWERRTITDEPRLSELVETYRTLGFEVHLEPLSAEFLELLGEECKNCYIDNWERYKIIFTRVQLLDD